MAANNLGVCNADFPGPVLLAGTTRPRLLKTTEELIARGFEVLVATRPTAQRMGALAQGCVAAALDVGGDGLAALPMIEQLHAEQPELPILVLASDDSRELCIAALGAGADACLSLRQAELYPELEARLQNLKRRGVLARRHGPRTA